MAAFMMRIVQINSSTKILAYIVTCVGKQASFSTTISCYRREPNFPDIKPIRPEGEWGDMDPKLCRLWDREGRRAHNISCLKSRITHLTEKKYKTWKFPPINVIPRSFQYQCGVSKTCAIDSLPEEIYNKVYISDSDFVRVKNGIIESLEMEHHMERSKTGKKIFNRIGGSENKTINKTLPYEMSRIKVQTLLTNMFRLLGNYPSVNSALLDRNVIVGAYFHRDGIERQKTLRKPAKKSFRYQNNAPFYGEHVVDFQLRKRKPMQEFATFGTDECQQEYPTVYREYKPKYWGQFAEHLERKVTSGFTLDSPLDPFHFTHMSVLFSNKPTVQLIREQYGEEIESEALKGYGLVSGFLSTLAQAHVRGFSEYVELPHSINTQTVITDGRVFRFSAFQLNTTQLWKHDEGNKVVNLYWANRPQDLYEGFENGKLVGFNEDTLRLLVNMFLIPFRESEDIPVHPYPEMIPEKIQEEIVEEEFVYDK